MRESGSCEPLFFVSECTSPVVRALKRASFWFRRFARFPPQPSQMIGVTLRVPNGGADEKNTRNFGNGGDRRRDHPCGAGGGAWHWAGSGFRLGRRRSCSGSPRRLRLLRPGLRILWLRSLLRAGLCRSGLCRPGLRLLWWTVLAASLLASLLVRADRSEKESPEIFRAFFLQVGERRRRV